MQASRQDGARDSRSTECGAPQAGRIDRGQSRAAPIGVAGRPRTRAAAAPGRACTPARGGC